MKWWPLVWRSTYDAVCAERDSAERRARRREKRQKRPAAPPLVVPYEWPVEWTATGNSVPDVMTVTVPVSEPDDLPRVIVEAVEARMGSLTSRTAGQVLRAATQALRDGKDPEAVAEWIWKGDEA